MSAVALAKAELPHTLAHKQFGAASRELSLQRSGWNSHRLLDHRGSQETQWFFDDELRDRADRNLEHLFTLPVLLLPEAASGLPFARSTLTTSSSKEPLSSIWKARRRLRVNSCCGCSKQTPRCDRAPLPTVARSKSC